MAKGIYVGVREDAFLSTNINNTNVRKWVTSDYKPTYGFKIKFTPQLSDSAWQHILNVGGRGNNTIFCLALNYGALQLEAPTGTTASTKQVIGGMAYTVGDTYEVEYLVDTTTGVGTFKINGNTVGTLSNINVSASASSNQMALFNCASTASGDARPTQIDWYYLEIYESNTLVSRFTPAYGPAITEETGGTSTTTPIANVTYTAAIDTAHKVNKVYVGENGVAKNVTQVYIGNPNNEAALSFGSSGPQPFSFSVIDAKYDPSDDYGKVVLQFNRDITLVQDTGEDPIQVMLDDHQGTIQSLVYYPGYDSTIQVTGGCNLCLDLSGGTFISDDPNGIELEIQEGVITSQNTGEIFGYIRIPLPIEIITN